MQIRPDATAAEIRKAYRQLALHTHPDKPSGDRVRFERLARAYAVLSEPWRREDYDRKRLAGPSRCSSWNLLEHLPSPGKSLK